MTSKRWIAVGLSITVFIVSLIIPAIGQIFIEEDEEESTGFLDELLSETSSTKIIEPGDPSSSIAILDVNGQIIDQEASVLETAGYNHKRILDNLEIIKSDERIKAIVLRVNSPGGGVYESAELADKIKEVKKEREIPVYTVMESMAASGGYYIAANSEKIYAQSETITGSIGVIMQGFNISELLDNLGIEDRTIKSGDLKDIGSTTREASSKELEVMQNLVDNMYERFVDTVESGRKLSREEIYDLADGRIYDGSQAVENGLVDKLGYFDDALEDLRKTYKLEDSQLIQFQDSELNFFGNSFLKVKELLPEQRSPIPEINKDEGSPQFMYMYEGV